MTQRVLLAALLAVLAGGGLSACGAVDRLRELPPDERFGHRYDDPDAGTRRTLLVVPREADLEYLVYPAFIDSMAVRVQPYEARGPEGALVEVLVMGILPDLCYELDGVEQSRRGPLVYVTLTMRRPRRTNCALARTFFRYYVTLDERYEPGAYTLFLNDAAHPFVVPLPPRRR
jgi:hypothetical protein